MKYRIRYKTREALMNDPSYNSDGDYVVGKSNTKYYLNLLNWLGEIGPTTHNIPCPFEHFYESILFEEIIYES